MMIFAALMLLGFSPLCGAELSDPTRPERWQAPAASGAAPAGPKLTLSSVLIGSDRRLAVIDDELVGVGDSVSGYRVIEIQAHSVLVASSGGTARLQLDPNNVRKVIQ